MLGGVRWDGDPPGVIMSLPDLAAPPGASSPASGTGSRDARSPSRKPARDAEARVFCYADATVRKDRQNDAILDFVADHLDETGSLPGELVFDSRLTTRANLAEIDRQGIAFLTLRRRSKRIMAALRARP